VIKKKIHTAPAKRIAIAISIALFGTIALLQNPFGETLPNVDASTPANEEEVSNAKPDTSRDHEGDTFSIVAYDPVTGKVGGAACSCVGFNGGIDFLNDLIVDSGGNIVGGINSQAAYNASTQAIARTRMLAGDTPQEIMDFVVAADGSSASRQYGVVGFDGGILTTAGFSGGSNGHFSNHIGGIEPGTGIGYSIQGNILDNDNGSDNANGQDLLNDMETSFLAAEGTLADKLMAALQGAKRTAGDSRCNSSTNSGRTAFIRVLSPGEGDNNPGLSYNTDNIPGNSTTSGVPNFSEPIDKLQDLYDDGEGLGFCRTTVNTFPYAMDFETNMWERENPDAAVNDNDRSWMRDRSATPTGSTGPNSANQGTFFAYLEASTISGAGDEAAIISPCFEIPLVSNAQITFDYHMLGGNIGTMRLEANDGSGWVQLWSRSGAQGSSWFNDEVVDLTAYSEQTVKFRFRGDRNGGFEGDMAIDDINVSITPIVGCAGVAKVWNGAWNGGTPPNASNTVTINANYDTAVNGNIDGCSLTVSGGSTLTVRSDDYLQINGNIVVDGTLIVEHQGNVVQIDDIATVTNNGTINVNQTTPTLGSRDFLILGSPMTGETRGSVWGAAFLVLDATTANFVPHPQVAIDFPGAENFADDNNDYWAVYAGGSSVDPGEGYLIRPQAGFGQPGGIFNYVYDDGTLNTGDINFAVGFNTPGPLPADNKNASPNALANPYPSAISANDFINANAMIDEVFFWEHLTPPNPTLPGAGSMNFSMEDISMYNLLGGTPAGNPPVPSTTPNGIISTGQGFGIKATAGGTAIFTNAMRRTSGNTTLRGADDKDRIWLNITNELYEMGGSTLIGFTENATAGKDNGYDSRRLAKVVSLYSHLEDGSEQLGIQSREAFESGAQVPLGFSTQIDAPLEYKISIMNIEGENLSEATVFLIDHFTNTVHTLSDEAYAFTSNKGTFHNRFTIQFEGDIILGTNANALDSVSIFPNPTEGTLNILSPAQPINSIQVYDMRGRILKSVQVSSQGNYTIDISELEAAVYFITITTDSGSVTKRILKK